MISRFSSNNPIETRGLATSYFLETKRSAVGSFCGAVYAVVRLSVCHVGLRFVWKNYCVKTLGCIAGCVAVPPGVSQIFPPHEKAPPVKIYACSGGLLLAHINAPHLV